MSKVLLVDTNFSSAPMYDYLIESGHDVFVCGSNPNDYLARTCSNYINQDYSNINEMSRIVGTLAIDYIVPGCNDLSYNTCSVLNTHGQYAGLDREETTDIINNKKKYRKFSVKNLIPVPRIIDNFEIGSIWPIIVKPVDGYSGRGMSVLTESERDNLDKAIALAKSFSKTNCYIIEEYVTGQLYSHSAFIKNHVVVNDFIVEEHGTANPFVVDTSRVINDFSLVLLERLRKYTQQMATVLNLVDGLVHTQFIAKGDSLWIIEVTRRCPGDLYSYLIQGSTGFCYTKAYTNSFINNANSDSIISILSSHLMRHTISQPNEKTFDNLHFYIPCQIDRLVPLSLSGDRVKASPFGRIALLFIKASSANELMTLFEATLKRTLYAIK